MKLSKNVTILTGAFAYFLASAMVPLHGNAAQVGSWAKVFSSAAFADEGESEGGGDGGSGGESDSGESDHDSGHDSGDHDSGDDHDGDHSGSQSDDGPDHDAGDDSGPKTLMDLITK